MKWKSIILLFTLVFISAGSLISVVIYYHFDWKVLADASFYENLANPSIRIVRIQEGLRKEQIADIIGSKLGWGQNQKDEFSHAPLALGTLRTRSEVEPNSPKNIQEDLRNNMEGYYFPKSYMLYRYDDPLTVSRIMLTEFAHETSNIKKPIIIKDIKPVDVATALKVASIIQREAGEKSDMNLISGIIWNRIKKGMKLQIDATLQYAKGSSEDGWWPQVEPKDKHIESPFNTYMYKDLPPFPIANPGLAAITAAYNPVKTSCLFYLHDRNRQIHCARTYAEHVKNIQRYY